MRLRRLCVLALAVLLAAAATSPGHAGALDEAGALVLAQIEALRKHDFATAYGFSSRELRRNAATRSGGLEYRATTAQWHADRATRQPKPAKLAINAELQRYVQERLSGAIIAPSGATVPRPVVTWKGRRHGRWQPRRWARAWSPEQIARRLPRDLPDDESMRISHEAIYQALYVQGRRALRRELTACPRTGRALRVPRARSRGRGSAALGGGESSLERGESSLERGESSLERRKAAMSEEI